MKDPPLLRMNIFFGATVCITDFDRFKEFFLIQWQGSSYYL